MKKLSLSIITVCVLGVFFGCSKLKDENPATVHNDVLIHPDGFATPSSANFHGNLIVNLPADAKSCTECHGSDFNGGSSGQSCNTCHKHADGVTTPSSANFHGKLIAANNWSMAGCKKCHGSDYAGGITGKSCLSCHSKANGPENCTTCHGSGTNPAPPADLAGNTSPTARAVGAHQIHLNGTGTYSTLKIQCVNCHVVPATFAAAGHINTAVQYATIKFDTTGNIGYTKTNVVGTSGSAPYASTLPTYIPNPSYSSTTVKCSNTYCHGNFKNGNPTNAPAWNDTSAAACGTCHGDITKTALGDKALPKTSLNGGTHLPVNSCSNCHADVVDANYKIINPAKHMNGKLNVFGQEIAF